MTTPSIGPRGLVRQLDHLLDLNPPLFIHGEFGVMLIKDCVTKHESLCEAEGFEAWLARYGEFIL